MVGGLVVPAGAVCMCGACEKFFSSWRKLEDHQRHCHRGKKSRRSNKCPHCWGHLRNRGAFQRHVSKGKHRFPFPVDQIVKATQDGAEVVRDILLLPGYDPSDPIVEGVLDR